MRVDHKQFSEALRLLKKFNGKPVAKLAIFGCAKLTVGEKLITLHKRDGDSEIAICLGHTEPGAEGAPRTMVVPIEATIKALKAVKPDASKSLDLNVLPDKPCALRVGPLELFSGLESPGDLPAELEGSMDPKRLVNGAGFLDALARVAPAMSSDITRMMLNGAWIDGGPLIATDGHRMHQADVEALLIEGGEAKPYFPAQIVETLLALKKPSDVRLGFRRFQKKQKKDGKNVAEWLDGCLRCEAGDLTVAVRWQREIEHLPDYRDVMPCDPNVRITLVAQDLLADLKLCGAHVVNARTFPHAVFRCNAGGVTLRARSEEGAILDRAQAPAAYTLDGDAGQGGFNLRYLEDAIEAVADNEGEIVLAFTVELEQNRRTEPDPEFPREAVGPLLLTSPAHPERRAIIMPCQP